MRTEERGEAPVALFLFAHQDDEFGVYEQVLAERSLGRRVACAYLTSGVPAGGDPSTRNNESSAILRQLGIAGGDVHFAGMMLSIADGCLLDSIEAAADWIAGWCASFNSVRAVYVPAWEGGHPDHDILHAIAVQLCSEQSTVRFVRQFPLYNALGCSGPFFNILHPLSENGPVQRTIIPWRRRFAFLRHALSYPSQRRSWIGLFPFMLIHYVLRGTQDLQPVSLARIAMRPHEGLLYYERRGFSSWAKVSGRVSAWVAAQARRG